MLETTVSVRVQGRGARLGSLGCLSLITALGVAGCGNELPGEGLGGTLPQQIGGSGAAVAQNDPGGGFFAAVTANGSGCSPSSIVADISDDGQAFTVSFSEYVVKVSPTVLNSTKNCTLSFKLESPKGLTFAIPTIYYTGYAFLEPGTRGTMTATYNFRNSGVNVPARGRNELVGPYDDFFTFEHGGDRVWAACGTRSIVNVNTQLRLQNVSGTATGDMTLAAVDGNSGDKLIVRLAWRPCQAPVVRDAGVTAVRDAGVIAPGVRATDTSRTAGEENDVWMTPNVKPAARR